MSADTDPLSFDKLSPAMKQRIETAMMLAALIGGIAGFLAALALVYFS